MTEDGWIQITTLVLATLGPILILWIKAKLAQDWIKRDKNQEEMHAKNTEKLEHIEGELNGKLAEIIALKVKEEVATALVEALKKAK